MIRVEGAQDADRIHDDALEAFEELHSLPIHQTEQRAEYYREHIRDNPDIAQLKEAFDAWSALWFWPAEKLDAAPLPTEFLNFDDRARTIVSRVASERKFFHWELAYPDVFTEERSGFDALVGNPPWETLQPNSHEFFSRHDPLYRTYGKQKALRRQREMFRESHFIERSWLDYNAYYKGLANFHKHAAYPFGDEKTGGDRFYLGSNSEELHSIWGRVRIENREGYADPRHPYRYQGSGKAYTYRMFLEMAYSLLRDGGELGLLVPSGLYSNKGSKPLRKLLTEKSQWRWLFGIENQEGLFDIHRNFKFNPVIARKGGTTAEVQVAFMRRDVNDWEHAEDFAIPYRLDEIRRLSPRSGILLEVGDRRTLELLDQVYRHSETLDISGRNPWRLRYSQGDFNMTSDSDLFVRREKAEEQGFVADEYGRWVSGAWKAISDQKVGQPELGSIRSRSGTHMIDMGDVEEVCLPLYQGRMINVHKPNVSAHVSGAGRRAKWADSDGFHLGPVPQYVVSTQDVETKVPGWGEVRIGFRDVTNATNARTAISCVVQGSPCGNTVGLLEPIGGSWQRALFGGTVMGSLVYDWTVRQRIVWTHFNRFYMEETGWPKASEPIRERLALLGMQLMLPGVRYAPVWADARRTLFPDSPLWTRPWHQLWALTHRERLRIRAMLDAVVAQLVSLDDEDLRFVLRDCDHPVDRLSTSEFTQALDPKGFWRVDQEKDPELRHTILTLVAFHDLQQEIRAQGGDETAGVRSFLRRNDGEGWQIPETLRLENYDLGDDERAKMEQPVRERLGPRFESWQLDADRQRSWQECRIHAANLLGEEAEEATGA